jgi:flavorubredoxin
MNGVTELVPGRLYRIGTTVPVEDLTWVADTPGAAEPLNCYLVTTAEEAIFLDAGPAVMRPELAAAADALIGDRSVWIFPSRNEFDCIGNLGHLLGLREDATLLFGGGGGILEWVDDPRTGESFLGRREIVLAPGGTSTAFADGVRFHWIDAPVKQMFLTQWAYEESTRTLFTSDFFGWSHLDPPTAPVVATRPEDLPAPAALLDELPRRTNWLPGAIAPEVLAAFDRVVTTYDVERVAPVHGRVLSGAATVRRAFADAGSALARLMA